MQHILPIRGVSFMQIVKGFYDNGDIVLAERINKYKGDIVVIFPVEIDNERDKKRAAFLGCMKGQGWISEDFNEPIDVMKDYM